MKTHTVPNSVSIRRVSINGADVSCAVVCRDRQVLAMYPATLGKNRSMRFEISAFQRDARWTRHA